MEDLRIRMHLILIRIRAFGESGIRIWVQFQVPDDQTVKKNQIICFQKLDYIYSTFLQGFQEASSLPKREHQAPKTFSPGSGSTDPIRIRTDLEKTGTV
jgi:hypothetical protein